MAENEKNIDSQKSHSDYKHIVRIANTDVDGSKHVVLALQKIKGIGYSISNMVCKLTKVNISKKAGVLNISEIEKLDSAVRDIKKLGAPDWMLNRRKDYETNDDLHLIGGDLKYQQENDKKRLQKIKSYRGLRLSVGLPVRGQRTKSNFRRNKGKGLGVKRKK